jgi:bifunctional polynucleotide phosphatase/kinase
MLYSCREQASQISNVNDELFKPPSDRKELVILVAAPASGKSTLSKRFVAQGYTRVNQDESGSLAACMHQAKDALKNNYNVVVDNTNFNIATRETWLDIARSFNVHVSIILNLYRFTVFEATYCFLFSVVVLS